MQNDIILIHEDLWCTCTLDVKVSNFYNYYDNNFPIVIFS